MYVEYSSTSTVCFDNNMQIICLGLCYLAVGDWRVAVAGKVDVFFFSNSN